MALSDRAMAFLSGLARSFVHRHRALEVSNLYALDCISRTLRINQYIQVVIT